MLTLVVCTGLAAFFGAYLKKRGEHQALKEVSTYLLNQNSAIESIKGSIAIDVASSTESLKAVIATYLATFQSSLTEAVQFKTGILLPRIEAYKSLWAMTYVVRPTRKDLIADFEKTKLGEDMTAWYYNAGNGIFLSTEAGELWRTARSSLSNLDDDKIIKDAFSDLRTQLKIDIRVYGEVEAEKELGT
jgi:hypothetical protein